MTFLECQTSACSRLEPTINALNAVAELRLTVHAPRLGVALQLAGATRSERSQAVRSRMFDVSG